MKLSANTKNILLSVFLIISISALAKDFPLDSLKLPPNFSISVYADNVKNARGLALGEKGTLFVGSNKREGKVYAILPEVNNAGKHRVKTIASGLDQPNGVAFYKGALYVATVGRILKFDDIENHLDNPPKPKLITDDFPTSNPNAPKHYFTWHSWKTIHFSPEGKLYIAIGAPCDSCIQMIHVWALLCV